MTMKLLEVKALKSVDELEETVLTVDEEGMRDFLELRSPQMPTYMRDIIIDVFYGKGALATVDVDGKRVLSFSADMIITLAVASVLSDLDEALNEHLSGGDVQ